jgi:hypothetical protein
MSACISREQVIARLREANWEFKDQSKRVDIYKLKGAVNRIDVPKRDEFPVEFVRQILRQAKLTPEQIEKFIREATKK